MIQFPTISLVEGTVRGFVLLKSLLRESTKKRKTQLDGITKVTVHPKISVIILTSEGRFLQYDLKEICPERDRTERKIRKICKEGILEKILNGAVPKFIASSEGIEEQKQEEERDEKIENKKDFGATPLNGQYVLGPNLFMKLEDRPNLFAKLEEEVMAISLVDRDKEKNLNKKPEINPRAFKTTIENNKLGFPLFPIPSKKDEEKPREVVVNFMRII